MPHRLLAHVRGNLIGYVALFIALGGSSYAAVRLTPGSVTARALAKGAVTHSKLANNSVTSANITNGTIAAGDFKAGSVLQGLKGDVGSAGAQGLKGFDGLSGPKGAAGPTGTQGPPGHDGNASIAARARLANSVTAPHGASTTVPLTSASWTQGAGQLELLAGSVTMTVPPSCTGSFGNSLVVSVDGAAQTFAIAPTAPAKASVTMPIEVGTLSEPDGATQHTMTAALANSCTKSGEDFAVTAARLDAVNIG
jgi:hypothetical protein